MSTQRWEYTKEMLEQALRLPPEQRCAFLDEVCGQDAALRAELESLISSYEQAGSRFLETAAPQVLKLAPPTDAAQANRIIGQYRLSEEIGRGGMGQVWLAEQLAPVRRRVALKLIRAGMYDDQVLRRFELERQSLAIMDHPNIAKVFDAGATPEGQPYFVMEYVPGLPITDYCDQKQLKIGERLELFVKVCEAVQHAHQKAILHRDLKPANILVQEVDGKPVPRIIDFGLAKATAPGMGGESLYTRLGGFVGTPGYMSPEQCDESASDVDTRSDVYSLGVVLYVLLTGQLPFQESGAKEHAFEQMLRRVREEDPPRPSTKVSNNRESSTSAALARGTDAHQLVSLLRGDLDWITMKALEKDRARRYGTAAELAADVTRYLKHEPVVARPASLPYRVRKYVRRHRVAVGIGAGLVAVLAGFAVNEAVQVRKITRERDRADRIAQFMTDIFKVSDPNEHVGDVTAREVLDKASKDIETGLAKDPELQARLMHVMGRAYMYMGLYPRAQAIYERSIQVAGSAGLAEARDTMNTTHDLAWTLLEQGRIADAEALERTLLEKQRRVLGPEHRDTLATLAELGFTLCRENKCAEGAQMNGEVLEKQKRMYGPEAFYTLVTMDNQATLLADSGRLAEAEKLEREALDIHLRVFGPENLGTVNAMLNLGQIERDLGHQEEAAKVARQALDIDKRVFGPNQPETAESKELLATILAGTGQIDEALGLLSDAVDHGLPPRVAGDIESDPHFSSLRGDPRFAALLAHIKERAAAQRPN